VRASIPDPLHASADEKRANLETVPGPSGSAAWAAAPPHIVGGNPLQADSKLAAPVTRRRSDTREGQELTAPLSPVPRPPRRVLLIDSIGRCDGGTQMMADEILRRADPTRFSAELACLGDGPWARQVDADGFPVYIVPRTRWRDVPNIVSVVRRLRDIIRTSCIDLVHATENSSFLYASLAARWAGVPAVWLVYDPLSGASLLRQMSARLLGQLRPSMIIFGSSTAPNGLPRPRAVPTRSIFPGVDLARARSGNGPRARRALGIPDEAPLIVMFGRVDPFKCQKEFLRALEILARDRPHVRAVICGWEPPSDYARQVRQLRSVLAFEDVVTITGYVSDSEKDDILAASDIVAHLAQREPFGLAVVDAMAAGKAVVAADAIGPASLIEDGVTGTLVPMGDVEKTAAAIATFVDDPAQRARMGAAAAVAATKHSVDDMVQQIEQAWDDVIDAHTPRQRARGPVGDNKVGAVDRR
jgi:glycosyltransferase involved in cell wall biosynthesis